MTEVQQRRSGSLSRCDVVDSSLLLCCNQMWELKGICLLHAQDGTNWTFWCDLMNHKDADLTSSECRVQSGPLLRWTQFKSHEEQKPVQIVPTASLCLWTLLQVL